ncbi:hypothetical protein D022_0029B, partial [Vibrio parahaemolyticus 12310]
GVDQELSTNNTSCIRKCLFHLYFITTLLSVRCERFSFILF